VRVAEQLSDARLDDAGELGQRGVRVRYLAEHGDKERAVERAVLIRQSARVALSRHQVPDAWLLGAAHRVVAHLLLHVVDVQRSAGLQGRRNRQRVVAGAGPDLEHRLARERLERPAQALA
jgi:hypothetical protein